MEFESEFTFRSSNLPSKCFDCIAGFRQQQKFCDITFTVGTQSISAHRLIVAAAIPFFQDVLSTEKDEIIVPDVQPDIFECLVEFAYSCELKITMENVRDLLLGACHFRLDEVRDGCWDFLSERLSPENALNFRQLAVDLDYPQFVDIVDHYVKDRFSEIYETNEFLTYPYSYIKELIGKEDLQVVSEEKVFEAVLKWVRASPDDRKANLPDLLHQVRMPLMSPLYLTDVAETEELIRTSLANRDLIDEARNYNFFPQRRKDTCSFSTEPRQFMKTSASHDDVVKECIYGLYSTMVHDVNCFNSTRENIWSNCISQGYMDNTGTVAELNNKMYFFHGGCAWEYDPTMNEGKYLNSPTVQRTFSGAAAFKNRIFVCGGDTGIGQVSNLVESFDPGTGVWKTVSPMRSARSNLCTVTLGEYLYALGGKDKACVHSSVERYPSVTGKWQTIAPMLSKRCCSGAAAFNGRIYVCGGNGNGKCLRSAEVYDPVRNKWEFISPMNTARCEFTLVSCRGKLYALGGKNAKGKFLSTSEIYDPAIGRWTRGPRTDSKNCISGAVVMEMANGLNRTHDWRTGSGTS